MYDWIVEADIYRLEKALSAAESKADRAQIVRRINDKRAQIGQPRQAYYAPAAGAAHHG